MPEVTLPVVPGMEGCHWPFRKAAAKDWPKLFALLLDGRSIKARKATGWLVDYAGPLNKSLKMAWKIASGGAHGLRKRSVKEKALTKMPQDWSRLAAHTETITSAARQAIFDNILHSCGTTLTAALTIQAKHSAGFMVSKDCQKGTIGSTLNKTMNV